MIGDFDAAFFAEVLVGGLLSGVMYSLVAIGFVLIYKTSGLANLAQGALAMAGAYAAWALSTVVGLPMWLAVPGAIVVMFGVGVATERFALRRMIGQPVIIPGDMGRASWVLVGQPGSMERS